MNNKKWKMNKKELQKYAKKLDRKQKEIRIRVFSAMEA